MSEKRSKFEEPARFMGSRALLEKKVRRAEFSNREGYAAIACFLPCSACGTLLPVFGREDLAAFDKNEFLCSDCKAEKFFSLSPQEQQRRRQTYGGIFVRFLEAFASRDERAISAVEAEFDELARLERAQERKAVPARVLVARDRYEPAPSRYAAEDEQDLF